MIIVGINILSSQFAQKFSVNSSDSKKKEAAEIQFKGIVYIIILYLKTSQNLRKKMCNQNQDKFRTLQV